jgi:transposase
MPDIITASEQDAYARFFASGGQIKKLPPCCLALEGAVPREKLVVDEEEKPRRLAHKTHDAKGRPINGWHIAYNTTAPKEIDADAHNNAREEVRAIERAKKERVARKRGQRNQNIDQHLARLHSARRDRIRAKLAAVLRHIGDEWTSERIASAAFHDGTTAKVLRKFLRAHGYGDKIPSRVTKAGAAKEAADHTERNAGICADYVAGVLVVEIAAKWRCAIRTVRDVVAAAGITKRPHIRGKRKESTKEKLAARDAAIRADYDANIRMDELQAKWGLKQTGILDAVKRAGGKTRHRLRQVGPRTPTPQDMAIAAAYMAGKGANTIADEMGVTQSMVYRSLKRCKVPTRDAGEARALVVHRDGDHDRKARVIAMHQQGKTTRQIAEALGYKGTSQPLRIITDWRKSNQSDLFAEAAQ